MSEQSERMNERLMRDRKKIRAKETVLCSRNLLDFSEKCPCSGPISVKIMSPYAKEIRCFVRDFPLIP